ncbi:hypothetical protein BH20CHL6_BH20CHL6_08260 [soil metagenome]
MGRLAELQQAAEVQQAAELQQAAEVQQAAELQQAAEVQQAAGGVARAAILGRKHTRGTLGEPFRRQPERRWLRARGSIRIRLTKAVPASRYVSEHCL